MSGRPIKLGNTPCNQDHITTITPPTGTMAIVNLGMTGEI